MKFRTTAIYFLILVVIGAVYAGMRFEKEKATRKEKQARRVFTFAPQSISQIEITSGGKKPIVLKKTGVWTITSPIVSQVDNMELNGFLSTLDRVQMERKIGNASGNLKAFGLETPSLVVRFLAGTKWLELDAGAKNPVATDRYARTGKNGPVFMISSETYDDLNKSLTDLRKKELFSWRPGQVKAFQVQWRNGDHLDIVRQGATGIWQAKNHPDLKISESKVDNLLTGLHWLRAVNFLSKGAMPATPDVVVTVELKDGKSRVLQVSLPAPGIKQAIATSSELPCPVLLSTYFLSSLPHSADGLVNRSLLPPQTSQIKKIIWQTAKGGGTLVRTTGAAWGRVEGSAAPKAVKNSWAIESLLGMMHNTDYTGTAAPAAKAPQGTQNSAQFVDVSGKTISLAWNSPAPGNTGPVEAWLGKNGVVEQVQLKAVDVQHIEAFLAALSPVKSKAPQENGASGKK